MSLRGMEMILSKPPKKRFDVFMDGANIFAMNVEEKASVNMVSNGGDVKNVEVAISAHMA